MGQASPLLLAGWANFYVIVGSAAGAMTGLQFVVMSLITGLRQPGSMQDIRAFGTPTVVHFCTTLVVSAIMTAPWPSLSYVDVCLGVCGTVGLVYSTRIFWHARKAEYNPDAEDWVWYVAVPCLAHGALIGTAIYFPTHLVWTLFAVGAIALLFLFVGIRNAWDTVTYISVKHLERVNNEGSGKS